MNNPIHPGHPKTSYSWWFLLLVALSVTTLITFNLIGSKLVRLGAYVLPAGILIFPLSYIMGDVLYEALLTPATYLVVNFLKRREGVDTYDCATSFNPLSLE